MPKPAKKRAHTPEDESAQEVVSKKTKKTKTSTTASGGGTGVDQFWDLSAKRRVNISKYNNNLLVSIREYYDADGELKPTKKGISLSVEQYKHLLKAIPAINEQLRKEGHEVDELLDDAAATGPATPAKTKSKSKTKTKEPQKANIEATSDEESD